MAALMVDGPKAAAKSFLFAHGAGAPMDSPFMQRVAEGVAASGVRVIRFEFPYMQRRRESGKGGAPDPPRILMQSFRDAIEEAGGSGGLVIGGKSMGGRIASMVADDAGVRGVVCLGYPFHPPGKPEKTRTKHLETLQTPALILQGTRDSFGRPEEVTGYKLSPVIRIEWLEDGDHSFKPRARSGRTEADNLRAAIALVAEFIAGC
ncbi:MAG TPA: alpha/beta family hydrolase [Candidatus Binatus sp.]|uniref:alpha/beta family hydrolase n=1 Tax=Candidatus Binatus sp. TaxID=2811406 RepID=UPI002B46F6EA|nr:alpha/beta family hydrolase [Candidatus Binatus sp.]HKN13581.1 alpha/beta family hydrolase [Candidatus Binatus sp.]